METFFDISIQTLNLFSFMLGMIFAFFNQGFFGKSIAKYVFIYLFCVIIYYGIGYHIEREVRLQYEQEFFVPVPEYGETKK